MKAVAIKVTLLLHEQPSFVALSCFNGSLILLGGLGIVIGVNIGHIFRAVQWKSLFGMGRRWQLYDSIEPDELRGASWLKDFGVLDIIVHPFQHVSYDPLLIRVFTPIFLYRTIEPSSDLLDRFAGFTR